VEREGVMPEPEEKDDIVVVVEETSGTVKEEVVEKPDPKDEEIKALKETVGKLERSVNHTAGSYRIIENLQKQVADLIKSKSVTTKTETGEPVKSDEELVKLINEDLVAGVSEIYKRQRKAEKEQESKKSELEKIEKEQTRQISLMETNKQGVLEKYPELNDPTSDYAKIWFELLDKKPHYKTNYLGPLMLMRDMEDECRKQGLKVKEEGVNAEKVIEKEVSRRTNVRQTSLKPGAKTKPGGGEVVLTQEQIIFCKHNNIPLKNYAATLKRLNSGEKKVEVQ